MLDGGVFIKVVGSMHNAHLYESNCIVSLLVWNLLKINDWHANIEL